MPTARGSAGQASVEFVALLPLLCVVVALAWQVALVGSAAWTAASSARSAARAVAVGRDAEAVVVGRGVRVRVRRDEVEVRVQVRSVLRAVDLGSVRARASFGDQGAG